MATYGLTGALGSTQTEMEGGRSAVSSPSDITTVFAVKRGEALDAVEVIATDARDLGWELEPKQPNGYHGLRRIDDVVATLSISAAATGDSVSVSLSSRS